MAKNKSEPSAPVRLKLSTIAQLETMAHPGQNPDGVVQELLIHYTKYMEMVATYTDDTPQMGETK